ncbi:2-hydroxyacid dehydrogenase [Egicoccus sp. AB-alg2]|uniref:2-hydroxyacid dehydrogenase n=1 Tax=Egicoccus sp. AB-alg2 TaxID=3242693 RepID=UPI00359D8FAB
MTGAATRNIEVWVPHDAAPELIGPLPDNIVLSVWDGTGPLPSSPDLVEVYVPPFAPSRPVAEAMRAMSGLSVVQALTAGTDHLETHLPDDVVLCNARGVHDQSVSEWVVAVLLATVRELPALAIAQEERRVRRRVTDTLSGKNVLILGHGSIGRAVERRLAPFDVEICRVASRHREGVHGPESLPELLPRADVVVLLLPETGKTRGIVDQHFLELLPQDAILINAARGGLIDQGALLASLQAGRIRVALDATSPDPLPPEHPLWATPGVLYTPHIAGMTRTALPTLYQLVGEQLHRYSQGRSLRNIVPRVAPSPS